MSTIISNDALKGQQRRIMSALRKIAQPQADVTQPQDITAALTSYLGGRGDYFSTLRGLQQQRQAEQQRQAQTALGAETQIYDLMQRQVAAGDRDAQAVDKAITDIVGADPQSYTAILEDLQTDPEEVTAGNARSKIMKIAAERGISPVSLQQQRAELRRAEARATEAETKAIQAMRPSIQETAISPELQKQLAKQEAKTLADARVSAEQSTAVLDKLNNMEQLLAGVETGPLIDRFGTVIDVATLGAGLRGTIGQRQAIDAAATDLQLDFTQRTKGAISDSEMRLFRQAVPGLGRLPEANERIISAMRTSALRNIEKNNFLEEWLRTHGDLKGANKNWTKYVKENKLVNDDFTINQENINNWEPYLTKDQATRKQALPQVSRDQALEELRRRGLIQ